MRTHITIGELASLMNVSIHQIRYFEEKEILFPQYIDENGYRMYGIAEIYTLAHILLLRKFNISVDDIKKCFENFSSSDYMSVLKTSIDHIDEQIKSLIAFRDFTKEIIEKANSHMEQSKKYRIQNIEERNLHQVAKINNATSFSAKQLYDHIHNMYKLLNVYEIDMINLYDTDHVYICMEAKKYSPQAITHTLPAGEYLCYEFLSTSESDFEQQVKEFLKDSEKNSLNVSGKLVALENTMLSMFYNDGLYYELQILIG